MIGRSGTLLAMVLSAVSAALSPSPPPQPPAPPNAVARPATGPTEIADLRTPTSTTFRFPNGARSVVLSSGPIRTVEGNRWMPIDLTLRRGTDGVVRPVSAPYQTWLSGGGSATDAAAVRGGGGVSTALAWNGTLPVPVLTANRAVYRNARPGANLLIEATRTGFVASLIPTGRTAGGLLDPATIGPRLTLREIGQNGGGQLVAQVGAMASRAAPAGTLGDTPVADRVVASAVRPSGAPFNTTVQNTAPNSDLSADPDLRIGSFDGQSVSRSFLSWDLRQLRGQKIAKATLRMYAEWAPTCQPQTWQVWSSGAIGASTRWASQPAGQQLWASSNVTKGHGAGCAPGWINVDLTELVRGWVAAGTPTGTVMVRAADEYSPSAWKRFSSAEGLKPPALGVTLDPSTP